MSTENNGESRTIESLRERLFTLRGKLEAYEKVKSFVSEEVAVKSIMWLEDFARGQISFYENAIKAIESEVGK